MKRARIRLANLERFLKEHHEAGVFFLAAVCIFHWPVLTALERSPLQHGLGEGVHTRPTFIFKQRLQVTPRLVNRTD
jgi:hypothetical protein